MDFFTEQVSMSSSDYCQLSTGQLSTGTGQLSYTPWRYAESLKVTFYWGTSRGSFLGTSEKQLGNFFMSTSVEALTGYTFVIGYLEVAVIRAVIKASKVQLQEMWLHWLHTPLVWVTVHCKHNMQHS